MILWPCRELAWEGAALLSSMVFRCSTHGRLFPAISCHLTGDVIFIGSKDKEELTKSITKIIWGYPRATKIKTTLPLPGQAWVHSRSCYTHPGRQGFLLHAITWNLRQWWCPMLWPQDQWHTFSPIITAKREADTSTHTSLLEQDTSHFYFQNIKSSQPRVSSCQQY